MLFRSRNIGIKKGDKVKVLRGQFKGRTGNIDKVDLKKSKAIITGVDATKKDGSRIPYPVTISNLVIVELNLDDKKRKNALERK